MNHGFYFDNAATTRLHPAALEAMMPYFADAYANPSSIYRPAQQVRRAIDEARKTVAEAIHAKPEEIFFTSGGTEADNWALKGMVKQGGHLITTSIEHHGIFHVAEFLKATQGAEVTYLPVDDTGMVNPAGLEKAIRPDTSLVSIMLANNEVGSIQPIRQLAAIAHAKGVPFHTDAVQAVGHIPVYVDELGVDMLSLSSHKFNGPKGTGALYVKKGTKLTPSLHGGAQERNRRAGTENVAGIIGMARALEISMQEMPKESSRITELRNRLIDEITSTIPHSYLNGPQDNRLPGNVNISFRFIEGEAILIHLDMHGFQASTGSACSSLSLSPSHVLMAMNRGHELTNGAIRFSLGIDNTASHITSLVATLQSSVAKIRSLSPLYDDYLKTQK
ncbi:MAG: cysteine desulfurase [Defluviitaleaceae bacterium]|nr:cysteine desulfurase [Defluviitaleaceae bacterium]